MACVHCESCRALADDTHPDYYVAEPESSGKAARSIKIEQIRALSAEIGLVPKLSGRRVVLIDDAERMNEAAQNSLLKTLEEPTGDVVFVLVTSARQALLDTIVSRCLLMPFERFPDLSPSRWRSSAAAHRACRPHCPRPAPA